MDTIQSKAIYASKVNAKRAAHRNGHTFAGFRTLPSGRVAYLHNVNVSLIDVLNDSEGRAAIDGLEDVLSSLDGKDGDTTLEEMRDAMVKSIAYRFGFTYSI
jgi:hypothetical protein